MLLTNEFRKRRRTIFSVEGKRAGHGEITYNIQPIQPILREPTTCTTNNKQPVVEVVQSAGRLHTALDGDTQRRIHDVSAGCHAADRIAGCGPVRGVCRGTDACACCAADVFRSCDAGPACYTVHLPFW